MNPSRDRSPFWGYHDLLLFVGLALPALLAGAGLVKLTMVLLRLRTGRRAVELIPTQFLGYAVLFGALALLFRIEYRQPFWRSLRWVRPPFGMGAIFSFGIVLAFASAALGALLRTPEMHTPMQELLEDRLSILLVGIAAVSLGPLFEELAFRGFMQPLFVGSLGVVPGILIPAVLFGLLHLQQYAWSWRHGVIITMTGLAFGWMRHRSGSTLASALMHAAYNLTLFSGFLVAQGRSPVRAW